MVSLQFRIIVETQYAIDCYKAVNSVTAVLCKFENLEEDFQKILKTSGFDKITHTNKFVNRRNKDSYKKVLFS